MQILSIAAAWLFAVAILQVLHILPWVSWHSEIMVFASTLALAFHYVQSEYQKKTVPALRVPLVATPLIALCLIVLIQWATGLLHFGGDAFNYVAYLSLAILCVSLGFSSSAKGAISPISLAVLLTFCAVCSALIAFMQISGYADNLTWIAPLVFGRPGANIAQPNQLATLLLMGLCSVIYLYEVKKISATTAALITMLLVTATAATQSRAGVLSFLLLALWWTTKRVTIDSKLRLSAGILTFSSFFFFFFYWPTLMAAFNFAAVNLTWSGPAAYNRWLIWPQLIQAILHQPWFGWGFGQVSKAHNSVVHDYLASEAYSYSHNILIDIAIGIGIPLALIFVWMALVWIFRKVRTTREVASWYCMALLIPVGVHSLFEFPFAYAYFMAPVMVAIGFLTNFHAGSALTVVRGRVLVVGICVATALLIWSIVEYIRIEEDFRVVRFEALRYGQTPADYLRPQLILFTQLDALLTVGRIVPTSHMSEETIEVARTVALRFPWTATQNRYALSLALNGNHAEAVRQLRVMRALHGAKHYAQIKQAWIELGNEKYPELKDIQLPD